MGVVTKYYPETGILKITDHCIPLGPRQVLERREQYSFYSPHLIQIIEEFMALVSSESSVQAVCKNNKV